MANAGKLQVPQAPSCGKDQWLNIGSLLLQWDTARLVASLIDRQLVAAFLCPSLR